MLIRTANQSESEALSKIAYTSKAHWGYSVEQLAHWQDDLSFTPESIEA
jgi:hypothetical protein